MILTGQVTEECILYSALGAAGRQARHFLVVIPRDAVAHIDAELVVAARKMTERNMSGELTVVADCPGSTP